MIGIIDRKKIFSIIDKKNLEKIEFALELSFKERDPIDKNLRADVKKSVEYWKKT